MNIFPSYQTPVKAFDMGMTYESGTRTFGHDSASPEYGRPHYGQEYSYDTPARYPSFTETTFPYVPSVYTPAPIEPCKCIHCDAAHKEIQAKYIAMQQQNSSSPYTDSTAELDQGTEDNTPSKSKTSKNKVSKSTKKREIPMHFAVTVQCRHKQSEYMSKFPVSKGEYVFVEGDRGEDVGQVVACENVDPTNSPKTSGNVLRSAKTSEIDAFHSLSDEEHNCVRNCQGMVETLRLPLIVVRAAYQYDRKKLTFFYEATDRVDFRALLHDLYQEYRCRIWMERVE